MPEIAIIAALEREIRPLVKGWRGSKREYGGRLFRFFENDHCVAVCAGIGPAAARQATEAIISLYEPALVKSVGFAGALEERFRVGQVLEVGEVIDAGDGSRRNAGSGSEVLVSFASVAGEAQKTRLAQAYRAQAVDMEAAAVAKGAEAHGLRFRATKVISDEVGFPMPPLERFVGKSGEFQGARFAMFVGPRPWLWGTTVRLLRNSTKASRALCDRLKQDCRRSGSDGVSGAPAVERGGRPSNP